MSKTPCINDKLLGTIQLKCLQGYSITFLKLGHHFNKINIFLCACWITMVFTLVGKKLKLCIVAETWIVLWVIRRNGHANYGITAVRTRPIILFTCFEAILLIT